MRLVTTLLLLALSAPAVFAEPVTYHLTGTVISVSDGTAGTLDLTGTFSVSAPVTLDITVQRSSVPVTTDNIAYVYVNAGTALLLTIGSYSVTGATVNVIAVVNDQPNGGGPNLDEFSYIADGLVAPPLGTNTGAELSLTLDDLNGVALSSGALPRPMPDMSNWSSKTFGLAFVSSISSNVGTVLGTFGAVTTPAQGASWGRIKADYR